MIIRTLVCAAALLAGASCATPPSVPDTDRAASAATAKEPQIKEKVTLYNESAKSSNMYCQTYMPTGSHRKVTRCVSKKQKKLEEDSARNTLMRMNRGSAADPALNQPTGP